MDVSLLLVTLLLGSVATHLSGNKHAFKVAMLFSLLAFAIALLLLNVHLSGVSIDYFLNWISKPNISVSLKGDGLSLALVLLTTALAPVIVYSSLKNKFENPKGLYALMLFMVFAMTGTFLAADGFLYYIFWELSLIPIYFIGLLWGNGDAESRKKAMVKFFIYTFAGSIFMLVAFIYLYAKAGSFLLYDLYDIQLNSKEQFWIFMAFFIAYAVKIPLIPFHTWQADTYQKSPAIGTMLLSGIMLKMALYSIVRWQLPIASDAAKEYMNIFIGISLAGVIYGSILALQQKDIKRLLAYSSLAHVGLIVAGSYTLTLDGFRGAVLQMLAHGFVIVGLFFVAEIIDRRYNTFKISEMGGIRSQATWFASVFMLLMLASVGLPGSFNFIGEFTLLYGLSQINIWMAIFGGTTIILGAFYMFKLYQNAMLGETNSKSFASIAFSEKVVFVSVIAVLIFFGLYPTPIIDLITPSLEEILLYINKP